MISVFEKYRYQYEVSYLFNRFLEYVIAGFDQTFSPIEKPFVKEEGQICYELFNAWIMVMNDELKSKKWYDALGELYMTYVSSSGKKQSNGQFFTPMHICDFMTKIVDPGEHIGESVLDNACGSGRLLLAAHIVHPGNYCCGQDLDRMCCLMAVCNFIIHGVNGEVVWGNSLDPTDFRDGWRTNEKLNVLGVPCVRKMDMMESKIYRNGLTLLQEHKKAKNDAEPSPTHQNKRMHTSKQPNLFYFDDEDEIIYIE